MKHKDDDNGRRSVVNLGRREGFFTFDEVDDSVPPDIAPPDLRTARGTFEGKDIKDIDEVSSESTGPEADTERKEEADGETVDEFSESSDPVRLFLRDLGKFKLLTREGEVEVVKRIEAGKKEVEEEILKSPVLLDYIIQIGEQGEAAEVDLHEVFEENEEAAPDEEKAPGADEAQRVRLLSFTTSLTKLHGKLSCLTLGSIDCTTRPDTIGRWRLS